MGHGPLGVLARPAARRTAPLIGPSHRGSTHPQRDGHLVSSRGVTADRRARCARRQSAMAADCEQQERVKGEGGATPARGQGLDPPPLSVGPARRGRSPSPLPTIQHLAEHGTVSARTLPALKRRTALSHAVIKERRPCWSPGSNESWQKRARHLPLGGGRIVTRSCCLRAVLATS
jgi:hypothetical protein